MVAWESSPAHGRDILMISPSDFHSRGNISVCIDAAHVQQIHLDLVSSFAKCGTWCSCGSVRLHTIYSYQIQAQCYRRSWIVNSANWV